MIILAIVVVLIVAGVVVGYYTRSGNDISQHPRGAGQAGDPGVGEGSSRIAGTESGEQDRFDTHGTK